MGAVLPSFPAMGHRLAAIVPSGGEPTVVELGAGTGAVSTAVAARMPRGGRHIAVEVDEQLAEHLAANNPSIDVACGNATNLDEILAERGVHKVDAVVSGLPWSLINPDQQHQIMSHIADVLAPGAAFTTFTYLHALPLGGTRRFRALLDDIFDEVLTTNVIWRNFPPGVTFVCRRPKGVV